MQVVKAPDNRLRIQTKPVKKITPGLSETIKQMVKLTLSFKDPEGVGLASTQVGLTERFFVGKIAGEKLQAFINPQIHSLSKRTKLYFEGCLSIPSIWGEVKRALTVKVSYLDIHGETHTETLKGIDAWIFQHEVDHLDGILVPDRVLEQHGRFYKFTGKDKTGQDVFQEYSLTL